ncbi:MAG: GNAT family N-acetyltransferase [Candidatus Dormibacteria bacterium]
MLNELRARGYAIDDAYTLVTTHLSLTDTPTIPHLATGYVVRTTNPDDENSRVECHRSSFAPSSFTRTQYQRARSTPAFDPELDVAAIAPDGSVVSFCLGWYDPVTRTGLLEPIGTHPTHQRRGLASGCIVEVLTRMRARGAQTVRVLCAHGSAGYALYTGLGFQPWPALTRIYRMP